VSREKLIYIECASLWWNASKLHSEFGPVLPII